MKKKMNKRGKAILKFIFPIPSIILLVLIILLADYATFDDVPATAEEKFLIVILAFIFIVIPVDVLIFIVKKIIQKSRATKKEYMQSHINDAQFQLFQKQLSTQPTYIPQVPTPSSLVASAARYQNNFNNQTISPSGSFYSQLLPGRDIYFISAGYFVIEKNKASVGMIQRNYNIGFNRAMSIIAQLEQAGVVGPENGNPIRKVLMNKEDFNNFIQSNNSSCVNKGSSCRNDTKSILSMDYDNMEGHKFEYFCADLLRKNGYTNVEVTKASGDQGIDIIAYKDGLKYGIQCKCYSSDIGNKSVQEAFSGKTFYNCHVAAVLTNRFFTQSAKELAKANLVLLWDRNQLNEFIKNAS